MSACRRSRVQCRGSGFTRSAVSIGSTAAEPGVGRDAVERLRTRGLSVCYDLSELVDTHSMDVRGFTGAGKRSCGWKSPGMMC